LKDPSCSVFILAMSDCEVVSLVTIVPVENSFDTIGGDLGRRVEEREDRYRLNVWDPREAMMSIRYCKLLEISNSLVKPKAQRRTLLNKKIEKPFAESLHVDSGLRA